MIVNCKDEQNVYESRDMGTAWTEAIGTLSGVWVKSRLYFWDEGLRVEALITANIEGRKVMLYTQRGDFSGEKRERALYLWVTDNNRSFYFGPLGMSSAVEEEFASTLLYSDGKLHLLQRRDNGEDSALSLSRLTKEVSTINSVLKTWAQKDVFFSSFSIPTAGLVAAFSDAASDDMWNDEYLCVNATVTPNAKKVKDGFQLTEPSSRVSWSVNTQGNNLRHVSLSHNFTLVASVTIEVAPSGNTPLLGAILGDTNSNHTMGLSYTADKTWGKMFEGKITTESRPWEPKKEYQVALMLQGNKVSVYVDGNSLGEEEVPLKSETRLGPVRFCFGACDQKEGHEQEPHVTVKNVFLYNRPLNSTEMTAIKDRIPVPTRGLEAQLEDGTERRHIPRIEGVRANAPAGSGLLPLLLLLGLWVFAAA
ncbi:trans-sialidase [Trypanosoma cruzi]|nr:trans-sialidase [Trypanosoma cruzi]